ncbi:MAG: isocitrate/isopropylmalate family dehydrogenase [Pseudomonadota bacterium]
MPGDGIGPEITAATRASLEALDQRLGLNLELVEHDIGFAALERVGSTFPDTLDAAIHAADAVILGPADTYAYPSPAEGGINPSSAMRTRYDLFANIRPAFTHPSVPSVAKEMDLVVVRENTEGFYADRNMAVGSGEFAPTPGVALAVRKITETGSLRIARVAFELAMERRRRVTMVHKANVLKVTDGLFTDCVKTVAAEFPEVELEERIVDAMAAWLVRAPERFDVVVTTNMFGDILSDEAAELAGGLGLAGSVNAGTDHAVAQAMHGSAPDIAGQGIANPVSLMRSAASLFQWLAAHKGVNQLSEAGTVLHAAVDAALADPDAHPVDLGGNAGTAEVGAAVARHILRD